jgi:hypothetical protein
MVLPPRLNASHYFDGPNVIYDDLLLHPAQNPPTDADMSRAARAFHEWSPLALAGTFSLFKRLSRANTNLSDCSANNPNQCADKANLISECVEILNSRLPGTSDLELVPHQADGRLLKQRYSSCRHR